MYVLQNFYLRTSRQLRLLDLESRSTLYTNFMETLKGIATIRAFRWQTHFRDLNRALLSEAQKPYYLMWSIQRWLNLMLDLIVAFTIILTMSIAMGLRSGFSGGELGLTLTSITTISQTLSYVIQSWTSMETSVGALMRLKAFLKETPVEYLPQEIKVPSQRWPSRGQLSFKDVTVNYR
jgi:ATP-binding cassette, subfamily C (CFTR/MRP), member 1